MASKARGAFDKNCDDIDRLLEIHADLGGDAPGRRRRLEVLNKSAIVLLTSFWEAYCEDLAAEALGQLVEKAPSWDKLPIELARRVAKDLEADTHDLAVWQLAGDGWRQVLVDRLAALTEERNRRLNTPKTERINDLFAVTLGIKKVSSAWYWAGMSRQQAADKLDRYVALRGSIAHRGSGGAAVRKVAVNDFYWHIGKLVAKTGGRVNAVVRRATGVSIL